MNIKSIVTMATLNNTYDAVAANFKRNADTCKLYRVDTRITVNDIMAMLSEKEKQQMKCSCCPNFFRKYSNVVYIEDGVVRSALFRDVDTDPAAKVAYNKLADVIELGKVKSIFAIDVNDDVRELGFRETGNFNHYHALISRNAQSATINANSANAELGSIYIALKNLAGKYKGLGVILDHMETLNTTFKEEKSITPGKRNTLQAYVDIVKSAHATYGAKRDLYLAAAIIIEANMSHRSELLHMPNSVFGKLIDDFIKKGYEIAVTNYLKYTDPASYKQRDTEKVAHRELVAARDFLTENDYLRSLPQSMAKVSELDTLWEAETQAVADEEVKTAAEKTASLFDEIIDARAPATPVKEVAWPTAENVGRLKFINEILPTAASIQIMVGDGTKAGFITRPTDLDSKPIFYWAEQFSERNYVTVMSLQPVPSTYFNIKRGYFDITFVSELPWFKEGMCNNSGLSEGWMIGGEFKPNTEMRYSGLTSYGPALGKALSRYAGPIDAVVKNQSLDYNRDEKYAVYWQLSHNWTYDNVRVVTKDGRRLQYNILNLD